LNRCRKSFDPQEDMADHTPLTHGHLLGGRVHYAQPREGFRSGIEPVLLAAALPARPGDHILEAGSGAGATLLCLAARVPDVQGSGIEQDASLVALAQENAVANGRPELRFIAADIATLSPTGAFDHACANPPYHPPAGTRSPDSGRDVAKRGTDGLLATWSRALARPLRPRGTLTLILPAALLTQAAAAFADAGCQPTAMLPLWPKAGRAAKLILLHGVKGARTPFRVLPGLVVHSADGNFTPEAEAILRDGAPLIL
jgi:tRNA1(Val) A37 N6-methylase TrmN6